MPVGAPACRSGRSVAVSAKETRLWLGTKTDFGEHKLGSYVEIDFISGQIPQTLVTSPAGATATTGSKVTTNAYNPALRRAYITFDSHWLFGQDWSTFQNTAVLPDTIDFIGATEGTVFVRQPQVRFTYGGLQLAFESPETTVYPIGGAAAAKTDDNYVPDFVARYDLKTGLGDFAIAGVARMLKDANSVGGADDNA